jgi:hypothetical protein
MDVNPTAGKYCDDADTVPAPKARPFFNPIQNPNVPVKHERARHRVMCQMAIAGFDNREIAKILEYQPETVNNILRQPWAVSYMEREASGIADDFKEKIIAEGQKAFARIVTRAEDSDTPVSIKQKDDFELVNRWLGKTVQPIDNINKTPEEMTNEELKAALGPLVNTSRISFEE